MAARSSPMSPIARREFEPVRQILGEVAGPMWKHPTAFYFGGMEFKGDGPPIPQLALICQAGFAVGAFVFDALPGRSQNCATSLALITMRCP